MAAPVTTGLGRSVGDPEPSKHGRASPYCEIAGGSLHLGLALTVERVSTVWSDLPVHALVVLPHNRHFEAGFCFQLDLREMGEAKQGYGTITNDL